MMLKKSSKEIIDYEYEKIMLIMKYLYLRDSGQHYDINIALAIYSKRHEDISVIDEEDD